MVMVGMTLSFIAFKTHTVSVELTGCLQEGRPDSNQDIWLCGISQAWHWAVSVWLRCS